MTQGACQLLRAIPPVNLQTAIHNSKAVFDTCMAQWCPDGSACGKNARQPATANCCHIEILFSTCIWHHCMYSKCGRNCCKFCYQQISDDCLGIYELRPPLMGWAHGATGVQKHPVCIIWNGCYTGEQSPLPVSSICGRRLTFVMLYACACDYHP